MTAKVYLIPTTLAQGKTEALPAYILSSIKDCQALFVENERSARRFLKLLSKEMVIDDFIWQNMKEVDEATAAMFRRMLQQGKNVGIISEAGCPGVADPGQKLVAIAQQMNVRVKPLVGPSAILLALMASGMNGQQFCFHGYLPIEQSERVKTIKQLEQESARKNLTQIFIETPYRNDQLLEALVKTCQPETLICIAADLTADAEFIKTKTAAAWKGSLPSLHKKPAIFLLYRG